MSHENVEKFRRGFAAVNHRDLDGFLGNVAPDVEFTSLAEAEGETFHGHDGVRRWWKEVVLPRSMAMPLPPTRLHFGAQTCAMPGPIRMATLLERSDSSCT
jgi:hypothetical protein